MKLQTTWAKQKWGEDGDLAPWLRAAATQRSLPDGSDLAPAENKFGLEDSLPW